MEVRMEWITANWEWLLIGFMALEKIVKLSPAKWDDILVDGIKSAFSKEVNK